MKTVRPAFPSASFTGALVVLGAALGACGGSSVPAPAPASGSGAATAKAESPKGSAPASATKADGKSAKGAASAQLAYQTGLQLLLKGDPEKARGEFQRAVELDPKMSEGFFELGKLHVHLSSQNIGSQARDLDVLDKGLAALMKACELEPSNDQYWYWVGKTEYVKNDIEKARGHLQKAVDLNPKHDMAWRTLGRVQKDAGEMEAARASFEKSIECAPAESRSYFQLGQTLEALGDAAGARVAYEKAIELNPTEPEVFGRLTQVCARLGDAACEERAQAGMKAWTEYDRQLQRRKHAVNQNPSDGAAVRRLGEMYFEVGNWEDAVAFFIRAIHIDPKDDRAHFYCGIALRKLKDFVNATNHLKEAEFLAPDNLDPKLELLRLYAETKDEAGAKDVIAGVEAQAAGESLWFLAEVCQELGRAEDAERLFGKAKAKGVTSAPAQAEEPPANEEG
jgi:tetratricopeptide (TPR) repeat protein